MRYREGTTQRSAGIYPTKAEALSVKRAVERGEHVAYSDQLSPDHASMLFGEYVITIWWPNWDALAGPLAQTGMACYSSPQSPILGRASTVRDWTPCSLPFHAFKGRVVQYVGRIPRPIQGKHTVEVHAYVDIAIPVLARMYDKRLTSFATFGVTTTNPGSADAQPRRQHSCRTPTDPTHAFSHTYPNQSRVRVRPSAVDIGSDAIFQEFSVARPP